MMKKLQIPCDKQDAVLNSSIKLKAKINALNGELVNKMKKYAADLLTYNIKVNELEGIIEKKDAENSTETINLLNKISELEQKLTESQRNNLRNEKELNYRAIKLDEYELKIHTLEDIITKLNSERGDTSINVQETLLTLQQTMENKSDRMLKTLGEVLSTVKIADNKHREDQLKTPAAMESLIKMLQSSDEACKALHQRNSTLEASYNFSVQQNNILKSLLYNNIILRYNFQMFIAKMFLEAINGLLADLHTVLQHLSNGTKPTNNECLLQINSLKLEYFKYKSSINDLQVFKMRIDEHFATDKISLTLGSLPELQNVYIPVSILHLSYLPMVIMLRQQNQINGMQFHLTRQQLNVPSEYMQPFVTKAPILPQLSNDHFENSVTIEDISSENSENTSNSKEKNKKIDKKSADHKNTPTPSDEKQNTDLPHHTKTTENDLLKNHTSPLPKRSPFKFTIKKSESKTINKNVFDEQLTQKNAENNFPAANDLQNNTHSNNSLKNSSLINSNSNSSSTNELITDNTLPDDQCSINTDHVTETDNYHSDFDVVSTLQSHPVPIEGVLDKLGGSNRLIKLYLFVKDKAKDTQLLRATDDELIHAILTVKKENTLHGMRKRDILHLICDFFKKKTEGNVENTTKLSFCVICFDSNDLQPSKTLSCNHQFHISCLQHWFQRDNICPICRKLVMTVEDLS